MIFYDLAGSDAYSKQIRYRPRTCFIMTQLGSPVPRSVQVIRRTLKRSLKNHSMTAIDANYNVTGKDFLDKIWDAILSVPIGVGIITEEMSKITVANIFYEIGLMQALGKETVVIKTKASEVPSDFVRTEYIEYGRNLGAKIEAFLGKAEDQAEHYRTMSEQLQQNPVLAIDYLMRAYLITGESKYKAQIMAVTINCSLLDKQCQQVVTNLLEH